MLNEDDIITSYMPSDGGMMPGRDTVVFSLNANRNEASTAAPQSISLLRARTGERLTVVPPAIVGRGANATVKVSGNLAISRNHARIQFEQGRLTIIDLGSINGTRVRGERIPSHMAVDIYDGDQIGLASEKFALSVRG